jgi:hypothetical protein
VDGSNALPASSLTKVRRLIAIPGFVMTNGSSQTCIIEAAEDTLSVSFG